MLGRVADTAVDDRTECAAGLGAGCHEAAPDGVLRAYTPSIGIQLIRQRKELGKGGKKIVLGGAETNATLPRSILSTKCPANLGASF